MSIGLIILFSGLSLHILAQRFYHEINHCWPELMAHFIFCDVQALMKGFQPSKASVSKAYKFCPAVVGIRAFFDETGSLHLLDQFTHRLLRERGASREFGKPGAVFVEVSCQVDMGRREFRVPLGSEIFDDPVFKYPDGLIHPTPDIALAPRVS